MDGTKAVEVQSIYQGVVTNTRHLTDATGRTKAGQSKAFIGAGIASVIVALVVFFIAIVKERKRRLRRSMFI